MILFFSNWLSSILVTTIDLEMQTLRLFEHQKLLEKMISRMSSILESSDFFAQLFWKKMSRYCHSPGVVIGEVVVIVHHHAKTLTFSNISVITEDIYLKLREVVHYQKGNPFQ